MKGLLSAVAAVVLGAVWGSAVPAPASKRQGGADPETRTRVKLHPSQIRLLGDSDYHQWSIEAEVSSSTFSANGLDFTFAAGDGSSLLEGNWNKLNYRQFLPTLGQRLVGTAMSTQEDADDGSLILTISGLPDGEHTLLTWHNSWQAADGLATVSVSVNGEDLATVRQCAYTMCVKYLQSPRMPPKPAISITCGTLRPRILPSRRPATSRSLTRLQAGTTTSISTVSKLMVPI